jgi:hypothetical protein
MKSVLSGFCLVALFASTRSDAQQVVKSGFSYGAFAGGAFGAAWGAAAPILSSECSSEHAFGRSLLGSAAGTAIGLLAFRPSGTQLLAVPLLSISGAVLAQRSC